MVDVAEEIVPTACKHVQDTDEETKKKLLANGVKFEEIQPEAKAKFKDLLKGVAKTWADGLDARGKRGNDALKEYDALVAAIAAAK
jgi:TRAP-type C4-dicarboxylate transport system substrate-binding protein